jgi:lysophospholipase L1-like esterase
MNQKQWTNWMTLSLAVALLAGPLKAVAASDPSTPETKKDSGTFLKMHESFLQRTKEGPVGLLFLGDSITAGWTKAPEVWRKYYEKYQPANFGIGGDRTEHVLWRILNGELEGIDPQVVVLMLGTNNTGSNDADQIAAADVKIVQTIRSKLPRAKVLVLGIFPRGPRKNRDGTMDDGVKMMAIIQAVNAKLAKLDDGEMVRYLDIGDKFLVNGKIPDDVMPDQLHPNAKGYEIWASAMQPTLEAMMKK